MKDLFLEEEEKRKAILISSRVEFNEVVPALISEGYRFFPNSDIFYIEMVQMVLYLEDNKKVTFSDKQYYLNEQSGFFKLLSSEEYLAERIPKNKNRELPKKI